jgi:hypothetical protein
MESKCDYRIHKANIQTLYRCFLERVAIKIIDKTVLDSKTTKMLLREISVMSSSNHPCLVK